MNPPVTLKRVARIVAGQSPSSADVEPLSVGLPFIQGNAEFGSNGPNPIWECVDPPKRAIAGDVLVSVRAPVGAVTVADRDYGIGRGLNAVRAEKIDPTYLIWLLRNSTGYLNSIATGSTFAAITSSDVASVGVPITPLDEQRQIAEYLDRETGKIDELITKQGQLVEMLSDRCASFIESCIKPRSGWSRRKLAWDFLFLTGDRGVNYPTPDEITTSGVPFINAGDLVRGELSFSKMKYVSPDKYAQMGGAKLRSGDILYCLRGTLGKNAHVRELESGALASSLVAVRNRAQLDVSTRFVFWMLNSSFELTQREFAASGSAQPNLSAESLAQMSFLVPKFEEQIAIAGKIDAQVKKYPL